MSESINQMSLPAGNKQTTLTTKQHNRITSITMSFKNKNQFSTFLTTFKHSSSAGRNQYSTEHRTKKPIDTNMKTILNASREIR